MKMKNARIIAKILASRAIDSMMKYGLPDSNCQECDELVAKELEKLSGSLIGQYESSPKDYKALIISIQNDSSINAKMNQGRIKFE